MPIPMNCPHCGTSYRLVDQFAGRKVRCKKCNQVFVVASADQPPVVQPTAATDVLDVQPVSRPSRPSIPPVQPVAQDLAARVVKKSRDNSSSSVIFWLLLLGGIGLTMVLVVGLGGVGLWLIFRAATPQNAASPQNVEDSIQAAREPAKGIEELKAATVFVKVTSGPVRATGSGFVIRVDGNTAYVVTNDHVIHPKAFLGGRGARRDALPPSEEEITLVFWSGTKQEHSYRAEIAANDPERDLAVLKVAGVANLPRPVDTGKPPQPAETLPVTVLGFPFGAELAGRPGNPGITVSKGSISSIRRNDRDHVVAVQIDGALNPGNSGGPVVDEDGRLVGVAVATIRGAHIGLAVPGGELVKLLEGGVGEVRATTKSVTGANAEIEVEVSLIDPLKHVQSVTVHYIRSDLIRDNPQADKSGNWPELPGSQRVLLRLDGQRAVGTLVVLASDRDKAFTFQASYTDSTGRRVCVQPRSLHPNPQGAPIVMRPPVNSVPPKPPINTPPAGLGPIKRLPPIVYQPHVPAAKEEVRLTGSVADAATGGGGRYLILRLAGKKKLVVFDVQQGKIAKELSLLEEVVHFAAGANQLVIVYPKAKLVHLWNLATLERERSAQLPDTLTRDKIHQICMGSASAGPLFVYLPREKRTLAMDLKSLETMEIRWQHWAPNNAYGPLNMRASPDGSLLIGWGGGWAGLDVATFSDGQQVGTYDKLPFSGGMFALPSADGQFIFTSWGIASRAFNVAKVPGLEKAYLVPAIEPGYFLALRNTRDLPLYAPKVNLPGVSDISVYSEDRKRLFTLSDCDELKTGSNIHWEKSIYYYPKAGLLVTLGDLKDRLILRRVDLVAQLDKSGADYLVVLSRPPLAKAGNTFTYRLDIRSKKGGAKVKLGSGPSGLKVTTEGQISWSVPAGFDEPEAEVLVTITDNSGQEIAHTFRIEVAPR